MPVWQYNLLQQRSWMNTGDDIDTAHLLCYHDNPASEGRAADARDGEKVEETREVIRLFLFLDISVRIRIGQFLNFLPLLILFKRFPYRREQTNYLRLLQRSLDPLGGVSLP